MLFQIEVKSAGRLIQQEMVEAPHALGAINKLERHYPGRWLTLTGKGGQPEQVYWTGLSFEARAVDNA